MNWTKDKPTKEGWYWMWEGWASAPPMVVEVVKYSRGLTMLYAGCEDGDRVDEIDGGSYWFGPLEVPELPEVGK